MCDYDIIAWLFYWLLTSVISQGLKMQRSIVTKAQMHFCQRLRSEKVEAATGAAGFAELRCHWVHPVHFNNRLVRFSSQIVTKENGNRPSGPLRGLLAFPFSLPLELAHLQNEETGWENHYRTHTTNFELLASGRRHRHQAHRTIDKHPGKCISYEVNTPWKYLYSVDWIYLLRALCNFICSVKTILSVMQKLQTSKFKSEYYTVCVYIH